MRIKAMSELDRMLELASHGTSRAPGQVPATRELKEGASVPLKKYSNSGDSQGKHDMKVPKHDGSPDNTYDSNPPIQDRRRDASKDRPGKNSKSTYPNSGDMQGKHDMKVPKHDGSPDNTYDSNPPIQKRRRDASKDRTNEAVGEFAEPLYTLQDELGLEDNVLVDELARWMDGQDITEFVENFRRHHEMNDDMEESKAKPDFADIDGDGDKDEDMKKAAKDMKKENLDEEPVGLQNKRGWTPGEQEPEMRLQNKRGWTPGEPEPGYEPGMRGFTPGEPEPGYEPGMRGFTPGEPEPTPTIANDPLMPTSDNNPNLDKYQDDEYNNMVAKDSFDSSYDNQMASKRDMLKKLYNTSGSNPANEFGGSDRDWTDWDNIPDDQIDALLAKYSKNENVELEESPTMDTTQLITLMKNSGISEENIKTKLDEWANTPDGAAEEEATSHGEPYENFAQSVNLSLKRYLDAEDMKVGLKEHTVEDIKEAYKKSKG